MTTSQCLANVSRLLIDVRRPTEREWEVLSDASSATVTYGVDGYEPVSLSELDREAFAEAEREAVDNPSKPVAVICSLGIRSRASAIALREAGFTDVIHVADGGAWQRGR